MLIEMDILRCDSEPLKRVKLLYPYTPYQGSQPFFSRIMKIEDRNSLTPQQKVVNPIRKITQVVSLLSPLFASFFVGALALCFRFLVGK